jgi:protein FAM32A
MPGEFIGGALSFKGEKQKNKLKKKKQSVKHEIDPPDNSVWIPPPSSRVAEEEEDGLTEAERKARKRRLERERIDAEKAAQKSHRERIEEFNTKLASLTELNDIPRVSAAGNG